MGSIKEFMFDDLEAESEMPDNMDEVENVYPKKLFVDSYDVNHYHVGDIPVYEILDDDDIPASVAINEAVELAKKYGQDNSGSFVNGVLAKFAK